jgi:sugar/nucleoside kinase (ribokinase family)
LFKREARQTSRGRIIVKEGIAIAGNINVDHIKEIEAFPREGMLAYIRDEKDALGGCVNNTLFDLLAMDPSLPLRAVGCVGDDPNGQFVLKKYREYGAGTEHIKILPGVVTGYSDVIASRTKSTRTFFYNGGANDHFGIEDIDFERLDARLLHMGYALLLKRMDREDAEFGTHMARTLHRARSFGILTSLDVVSEDSDRFARVVIPALAYCDYLIINEIEGSRITGVPVRNAGGTIDPKAMMEVCLRLRELGVSKSVILHFPEGSWMLEDRGFFTMPSLPVSREEIQGTVGAGDAFAAGALYGLYHRWEPEDVLFLASCSAAANLFSGDASSGAKPLGDLKALGARYNLEVRKTQ